MKFIEILNEVYEGTFKTFYGTTEVYKNPTSKDFKNLGENNIRFIIALDGKNVYIFDSEVLHAGIANVLGIDYNDISHNIYGEGSVENNKIDFIDTKVTGMFNLKKLREEALSIDWSWADKYFTEPVSVSIKKYYR